MNRIIYFVFVLALVFYSCDKEETEPDIIAGDYPVKEYTIERNPKVNVWGTGMDFIHAESKNPETELDYKYLEKADSYPYDIKFYNVKAYYYDENNDLQNEGCPAILLSLTTKACKVGEGLDFFNSLTIITAAMLDQLATEPELDYSLYKDSDTGFYNREDLFSVFSQQCIIGNSFRKNVLIVPEGKIEQEVQPVFLIETEEAGYAKFMVRQFKSDPPNEKQMKVRWQVISE